MLRTVRVVFLQPGRRCKDMNTPNGLDVFRKIFERLGKNFVYRRQKGCSWYYPFCKVQERSLKNTSTLLSGNVQTFWASELIHELQSAGAFTEKHQHPSLRVYQFGCPQGLYIPGQKGAGVFQEGGCCDTQVQTLTGRVRAFWLLEFFAQIVPNIPG